MMVEQLGTVVVVVVVMIGYVLIQYIPSASKTNDGKNGNNIPYQQRNYIDRSDLLNEDIRANPHEFNKHIQQIIATSEDKNMQESGIVRVRGEKNTFLVCKYKVVKEILVNETIFSSNPFPDERLIAPNAMDDDRHKIIMKYLKRYYSQTTISKQVPMIEAIIQQVVSQFLDRQRTHASGSGLDAMDGICKQVVMKTALFMLGLTAEEYHNAAMVREWIHFNDEMVKIVAPLGGVGHKLSFSFGQCFQMLYGLLLATAPTLRLILKIGVRNAWNILRPDVNVLQLPDEGTPRTQLWRYPHILYVVPQYFLALNALYETHGVRAIYPNRSKQSNVVDGRTVLQSLYAAEQNGDMCRAEILVTIVQLMVNMTTANAMASMLFRISTAASCDYDTVAYDTDTAARLIEEVIRFDASLQRLPRRCRRDLEDFHGQNIPKNSNLLLMIGAANCDPDIFGEHAFEFRPNRYYEKEQPKSVSFGYGIHLCLGYLLVKREMHLLLKVLSKKKLRGIECCSFARVTDIDVGNYGFQHLLIKLQM